MAPQQKPGKSKQDYQTPPEFLDALRTLLGIHEFSIDLAADRQNTVAARYYDEPMNSLSDKHSWVYDGWGFLNPPYHTIEPWVRKAWSESRKGAQIAMLVPASPGSNWWRDWVHKKAIILLLNGRLTFVGETGPYPKDSALLLYRCGSRLLLLTSRVDYLIWNWKKGEIL